MGRRLTKETRCRIWLRDGGECTHCRLDLDRRYRIDHKVPHSRGGTDEDSNLQTVCRKYNGRKGVMAHDEYLAVVENSARWERIMGQVRPICRGMAP